jgi:periplasmic protein CpxP/Spy
MVSRRKFFTFAGLGALLAGVAWKAHSHGRHGAFDPSRLEEYLDRGLKHFYVELDATPEQQRRLEPIVKEAARELLPLREKLQAARRRGLEILSAPAIDRGSLEALRVEQLQLAETGSRRLAQALADVADVLTPEQRKAIAERMERHRAWSRGK